MSKPLELIQPDWPAPLWVRAVSTTRIGGVSQGAYQGLNLGESIDDDPEAVNTNRKLLAQAAALPGEPVWLRQQHTVRVIEATEDANRQADASYTQQAGVVCVIKTADCLPVLLCSQTRRWVAAVHVGWRGAAGNILSHAVAAYPGSPEDLLAWLGPTISAAHYEVDEAVRCELDVSLARQALRESTRAGHWLLSLSDAARWQLTQAGVSHISQNCSPDTHAPLCTHTEKEHFYSYRREGVTGRMATLIWMEPEV